jgi:hypothetical protein
MKSEAQLKGHSSRESWSILARIYARLYEINKDRGLLAKAFEAVFEAHASSPGWPWPLFQLSEFAKIDESDRSAAHDLASFQSHDEQLARELRAGNHGTLAKRAAQLACITTEFGKFTLGDGGQSRSGAFVLDDPHRLLNTTIVLKPTIRQDAAVEIDTTTLFGEHIVVTGLSDRYAVPRPVAVIPDVGDSVVYVMERSRGTPLSTILLGTDGRGFCGETVDLSSALEFLGIYHKWGGLDPANSDVRSWFLGEFAKQLRQAGLGKIESETARSYMRSIVPLKLVAARKKDAHPDNWLVAENGRVVMIDLESRRLHPALLDVVQLIDDYPVFEIDEHGWEQRLALAARYWKAVSGIEPDVDVLDATYSASLILRCVAGLSRCRHKRSIELASFSLRSLDLRIAYFQKLLGFLAGSHRNARSS